MLPCSRNHVSEYLADVVDVGIDGTRNDLIAGSVVEELCNVLDRGGVSGDESYADGDAARRDLGFEVCGGGSIVVFGHINYKKQPNITAINRGWTLCLFFKLTELSKNNCFKSFFIFFQHFLTKNILGLYFLLFDQFSLIELALLCYFLDQSCTIEDLTSHNSVKDAGWLHQKSRTDFV